MIYCYIYALQVVVGYDVQYGAVNVENKKTLLTVNVTMICAYKHTHTLFALDRNGWAGWPKFVCEYVHMFVCACVCCGLERSAT